MFAYKTAAQIGEGVLLDHATGVVIGETAVIGNRVSVMQVSYADSSMLGVAMSFINNFLHGRLCD